MLLAGTIFCLEYNTRNHWFNQISDELFPLSQQVHKIKYNIPEVKFFIWNHQEIQIKF